MKTESFGKIYLGNYPRNMDALEARLGRRLRALPVGRPKKEDENENK